MSIILNRAIANNTYIICGTLSLERRYPAFWNGGFTAQEYSPLDGRFITQDTYRGENTKPVTLHLYAYCHNNPINYVDPSGHKSIKNIKGYLDAGHGGTDDGAVRKFNTVRKMINGMIV